LAYFYKDSGQKYTIYSCVLFFKPKRGKKGRKEQVLPASMVDYFSKLTWMNDSKLGFDKWGKINQNEILKCYFLK